MAKQKVVLAYSGGLDTSVAIPWIKEHYDAEVITVTAELGQGRDLEEVRLKALATGAEKAIVLDGQDAFVERFVWPALRAGAIYEAQYPLATALARPLIAEYLATWRWKRERSSLRTAAPARATTRCAST